MADKKGREKCYIEPHQWGRDLLTFSPHVQSGGGGCQLFFLKFTSDLPKKSIGIFFIHGFPRIPYFQNAHKRFFPQLLQRKY